MGTDARYDLLGLPAGAPEPDIRQAFRRRAQETHPDHGGDRAEFEAVVAAAQSLLARGPAPLALPARAGARNPYARLLDGLDAPLEPDPAVLQAIRRVNRATRHGLPGSVPGAPFTSFDDVLDRVAAMA